MFDVGKRIQFLVNRGSNNTLHLSPIIPGSLDDPKTAANTYADFESFFNSFTGADSSNGTSLNSTAPPYDSSGAAKYIVVVVLVYGFGIIFFIASQVRSRQKMSDEVDSVNAEKILRSMETEIFTKEVLEKLLNKEHRERAWKIYLSDDNKNSQSPKTGVGVDGAQSPSSPPQSPTSPIPTPTNHNLTVAFNLNNELKQHEADQMKIYDSHSSHDTNEDKLKRMLDNEKLVHQIEKKLRMLNKVQSSYRNPNGDTEIETVDEALDEKLRQKQSRRHLIGQKLKKILHRRDHHNHHNHNQNKNDNHSRHHSSSKPQHMIAPKLILQTDMDGLEQMNKNQNDKHNIKNAADEDDEEYESNSRSSFFKGMKLNKKQHKNSRKTRAETAANNPFDRFETISEQITTV